MNSKNMLILIFFSIISLIICEIFLRYFFPQNVKGYYQEQNKISALWVLKKNNVYYDYFQGQKIIYETGNFNNRIINKKIEKKKINKDRILILGDSFTFGEKLEYKHSYVQKLQNSFDNYFFINSAVPGWGLSNYSRFVEDYCDTIKPKKIIIFFNTDDIGRVLASNQYVFKNGKLKRGNDELYNAWYSEYQKMPIVKLILNNSHASYLFARVALNLSRFLSKNENNYTLYPSRDLENTNDIIKNINYSKLIFYELKKNAEKCGASLYIIYSGWVNYKKNINLKNPTIVFLLNAEIFFKNLNIKFFDNVDSLSIKDVQENLRKYIIVNDHHPNIIGADKIFKTVYLNFKQILK